MRSKRGKLRCFTYFVIAEGVVHGLTVKNSRVFTEINCKPRTNDSFKNKTQIDHHVNDCYLLNLINFDPVKQVFIDPMYLFFEEAMKYILDQVVGRGDRG